MSRDKDQKAGGRSGADNPAYPPGSAGGRNGNREEDQKHLTGRACHKCYSVSDELHTCRAVEGTPAEGHKPCYCGKPEIFGIHTARDCIYEWDRNKPAHNHTGNFIMDYCPACQELDKGQEARSNNRGSVSPEDSMPIGTDNAHIPNDMRKKASKSNISEDSGDSVRETVLQIVKRYDKQIAAYVMNGRTTTRGSDELIDRILELITTSRIKEIKLAMDAFLTDENLDKPLDFLTYLNNRGLELEADKENNGQA